MKAFFNIALIATFAGNLFAQRNLPLDAIPDPDPASQQASFILDDGLEINLFAADPMIAKPVGMNWDSEGRLWVVSSRLYPHIKPGQRSDDQVIVLEDTNGDGAADKSTVFAEDLLIPTGIMPGDGGVYVANSTEMLFLKDTNGDLVEDERHVALSGFGTEDTHHIIHAFRSGPDGMLYFNQSIYIHSHVETPHGVRRLMAGGIWHFRPETMELEVFARGFVNSWGHAWDRYGQSFATDGAYGEGINYVFPGSVFFTAYNAKRILKGLNSGQPKHAGLEIINSTHFPDDWQGNMITNDFRGHRVNRFIVTESGSGFVSRQAPDLIKTNHGAFRPIDCKMGPDGALYIADWYNPIIQHGEVDFRDPRRDHTHGRIWRVTCKGRPLSEQPEVAGQPLDQVVAQLRSPDGLTRQFAKQELRNANPAAAAVALAKATPQTAEDKLELLWAHQAINILNKPLLLELLQADDHRIRAAAVRVLYHWHAREDDSMELLAAAVDDDHPRVRLEAINALRNSGGKTAFEFAMTALQKPVDENIDFALWLTARELESDWLPALEAGELNLSPAALQLALTASEKPEAIRHLHAKFRAAAGTGKDTNALADLFASAGGPDTLDILYDHALEKSDDAMLARLFRTFVNRKVQPADLRESELLALAEKGAPHAILLGGAWRIEAVRPILEKRLADRASASEYAVSALAHLGDAKAGKVLSSVAAESDRPATLRAAAVAGLVQIDFDEGLRAAVDWLITATSPDGSDVVLRAFLGRKDGPSNLASALEGVTVSPAVASAGVQQAGSGGGNTAGLVAALTKAGKLSPITGGLTDAQMAQFVKDVSGQGDAHRGQKIYRRANLLCQACHAIGGGGGVVGPDMLSVGASAPVDYIIDSLLEPNKKIKEGYHTTMLTTKDGNIVAGGLVRETDREFVLRLADGSEQTVPAGNVTKKEVVPVSLMPPGLTASLRKDELVDLVRFLSELGKEGDFKVPANRYVRRWRVLPEDKAIVNRLGRRGAQGLLDDDRKASSDGNGNGIGDGEGGNALPWQPAYSTVAGELPLTELGNNRNLSFARFEVDVTAAGTIGLRIDNPQGLQIVSGANATIAPAERESKITFPTGRHTVTLIIDRPSRSSGDLKVELFDVEGSEGRANLVGGL